MRFKRLVVDGRGSSTLYQRAREDDPWQLVDVQRIGTNFRSLDRRPRPMAGRRK